MNQAFCGCLHTTPTQRTSSEFCLYYFCLLQAGPPQGLDWLNSIKNKRKASFSKTEQRIARSEIEPAVSNFSITACWQGWLKERKVLFHSPLTFIWYIIEHCDATWWIAIIGLETAMEHYGLRVKLPLPIWTTPMEVQRCPLVAEPQAKNLWISDFSCL